MTTGRPMVLSPSEKPPDELLYLGAVNETTGRPMVLGWSPMYSFVDAEDQYVEIPMDEARAGAKRQAMSLADPVVTVRGRYVVMSIPDISPLVFVPFERAQRIHDSLKTAIADAEGGLARVDRRCRTHAACRADPDMGRACWDEQNEEGRADD